MAFAQLVDLLGGGEIVIEGHARGVVLLVEDDSQANQAHLLEHLTLEILGAFDHARRLSGVTCAYVTPPERNDVFVECTEPETGGFAAMLAVDAMNTALAGSR